MDKEHPLLEVGRRIDTGRKHTDGSVIYRKALSVGALPNATTKNVAHGESLNITGKYADVVSLFATNDTTIKTLHSSGVTAEINATNVVIGTGTDLSTYDQGIVVIEFCL